MGFALLCSCNGKTRADSAGASASPGLASASASGSLSLSAASASVSPNGTDLVTASGGAAPYDYALISGTGSVDPKTGLFTAPASDETDEIEVTDSAGDQATISITVSRAPSSSASNGGPLSVSPASSSVIPGATDQVNATGGTAPYSYYVVSGNGTIDSSSGLFTAPATDETDEVGVQDAAGNVEFATITVTTTAAPSGTTPGIAEAPVYRFYNARTGEHFYTLSPTEVGPAQGFTSEGVAFHVFTTQGAGMIPLYRCLWSTLGMHFISSDSSCEGWTNEGAYGYVYSSSTAGSTALYRFLDPANGDHLETVSMQEGISAGYRLEITLGYVPTS